MSSTRYILAGGLDRAHQKYWQDLSELFEFHEGLKVLSCFFSQAEKYWQISYDGFTPFFESAFGSNSVYELATKAKFIDQMKSSDVIYLHGGHTTLIEEVMSEYDNIESHFSGKTIIGSSAGANFLSSNYWSARNKLAGKGSGIVPANIMVHFGSQFFNQGTDNVTDWSEEFNKFSEYLGKDQSITKIEEGKFVVFEK
jgi:hypothetical protein